MKYRVLHAAQSDLDRIDDWVAANFGEARADQAIEELYNVFQLLADHPNMGIVRPELTSRPVRFFSSGPNWIVYEPGDQLMIRRVLSARMDIADIFTERKAERPTTL